MSFPSKYGPNALITGAAQGIGAEFARQLAMRGLGLVLVDVQADKVKQLAAKLAQKYGVATRVVVADLRSDTFMQAVEAGAGGLEIGLLINNAGKWETGPFLQHDGDVMAQNALINVQAPLKLAHYFGRKFATQKRGGMIFLSSISGFQGTPKLANYCATKAYNMRLAESLWSELGPHGVDVLALAPGLTRTPALTRSGLTNVLGMQYTNPPEVVAAALKALGRQPVLIPGWRNRATIFLNRFATRRLSLAITERVMR